MLHHTRRYRVVAALVVVLLPLGLCLGAVSGGRTILIDCCCGEHVSTEGCDCPDCLVAHAVADEERRAGGDPAALIDRIGQCGNEMPPLPRQPHAPPVVLHHAIPPPPPRAATAVFDIESIPPSHIPAAGPAPS